MEKATQDTSLQSRTGSSHRAYLFDRIWAYFTPTHTEPNMFILGSSLYREADMQNIFSHQECLKQKPVYEKHCTPEPENHRPSKLTPDAPNTFTPGQYVTWIVSTVSKTVQDHPKPTRYYKIMSYITYMPLSLKAQHDPRSIRSGSVRRDFQGTGQWPTPWVTRNRPRLQRSHVVARALEAQVTPRPWRLDMTWPQQMARRVSVFRSEKNNEIKSFERWKQRIFWRFPDVFSVESKAPPRCHSKCQEQCPSLYWSCLTERHSPQA